MFCQFATMGLQMISVLSYRKQGFPFLFNIFFIKEKLRKQTFESRPNTEQAIGENIYKRNEKNEVMSAQEYKKNLTVLQSNSKCSKALSLLNNVYQIS